MNDPLFIPPDPDEPVPTSVHGATDYGKRGTLAADQDTVPDIDLVHAPDHLVDEVSLMLAAAVIVDGIPSAERVLALAATQLKKNWGPPENINKFTRWYYGNTTKAAWCFIFISFILAMASGTEALGLALLGGKKAYVPYIKKVPGYKTGHAGIKPGAIVALFDFDHIEFFEKDLGGGKFQTIGGNTTYGDSTDAVARKIRYYADVSGHVNLAYATGSAPPVVTNEGDASNFVVGCN